MSGGRLQMKLIYGLEVLLAERLGYQLLAVVVHQVLGRLLGLYMNQSIGLHSQYIRWGVREAGEERKLRI